MVKVAYNSKQVSRKELVACIEELGYTEKKGSGKTVQIISLLIIILAVYLILNHLGLLNIFNVFPAVESSMELELVMNAEESNTPIISCMGAENKVNAAAFEVADI